MRILPIQSGCLEPGPTPFPDHLVVLSSNFHLFRIRLLARRLGLEVAPLAAPTPWSILPNCCLREFFALLKSLVMDHPSVEREASPCLSVRHEQRQNLEPQADSPKKGIRDMNTNKLSAA